MNHYNQKKSLQQYIVISPETFEELKPFLNFEKELSSLDREIYKILKDRKINNTEKWLRYRQSLIKQSEIRRKKVQLPKSIERPTNNLYKFPSYSVGTQTKYIRNQDLNTTKKGDELFFIDDSYRDAEPIQAIPTIDSNTNNNDEDCESVDDDNGDDGYNQDVDNIDLPHSYPPLGLAKMHEDIFESEDVDEGLVDNETFQVLPKDVQNKLLQKLVPFEKNPSLQTDLPNAFTIYGNDGIAYNIPTKISLEYQSEDEEKNTQMKTPSPKTPSPKTPVILKSKKKITTKFSPKRTRSYLNKQKTQGLKQTTIDFPATKKIKWDSITD